MKIRFLRWFLYLLLVWALYVTSVQAATEVVIDGKTASLDTGIYVQAGDVITITATGLVSEYRGIPWNSPDGWGDIVHDIYYKFALPSISAYSLIGAIDGPPFDNPSRFPPGGMLLDGGGTGYYGSGFVGSNFQGTAPVSGNLFLGFNDCYYPDNVGSFTVDVSTSPPLVPVIVDIDPDLLEVEVTPGKEPEQPEEQFLEAFIELPVGISPADINVDTVTLSANGTTLAAAESPLITGDVLSILFRLDLGGVHTILGIDVAEVEADEEKIEVKATTVPSLPLDLIELTVSGELISGGTFSGTDAVRMLLEPESSFFPLVQDVESIVTWDGITGPITLTDPWAPIVSGDENTYYECAGQQYSPAILAGACYFGSGQVFAIGHEWFFGTQDLSRQDNEQFGRNIVNWLDRENTGCVLVRRTLWSGTVEYGLLSQLASEGYEIRAVPRDVELTQEHLEGCGVLVICHRWDPITSAEIDAIVDFVSNGGGLWLFGLGWSYYGYVDPNLDNFPMNQIGSRFGVRFEDGVINDPDDYVNNCPCHPIYHTFYPEHP